MTTVQTMCRICECACGLEVAVADNRVTRIRPDQQHPYNWRDFCVKGASAHKLVADPRRIRVPMRRDGTRYVAASYAEAIEDIAVRLRRIVDEHGADAVAGYLGNPPAFGFSAPVFFYGLLDAIGTRSRYSAASVDTNAWHLVNDAMFGDAWLPVFVDLDACDCLLLIGSNPAVSGMMWMGDMPDGWRRALAAQAAGAEIVIVDPRRTESARRAAQHLAPVPGEDWALLAGMLKVIFDHGWVDSAECDAARGVGDLRALLGEMSLDDLAGRCGVPVGRIADVARRFARAPAAGAIARTGVAQAQDGVLAMWLTQVLNLVTGRYGRPGGAYTNLPPHDLLQGMLGSNTRASRVRGLDPVLGHYSLAELPGEITTPGAGQVRALLLLGGNPVVTGPQGASLDAALAQLDLCVSVDLFQRESHRHAHWLIPAMHWLEREEFPVIGAALRSRPFVQYARRAVQAPPGVRDEWEFFFAVAMLMDRTMYGVRWGELAAARETLRACLDGTRAFDLLPEDLLRGALAQKGVLDWERLRSSVRGYDYAEQALHHPRARVRTADGRIDACPPRFAALLRERVGVPSATVGRYPLQLISRRRTDMMNSHLSEYADTRARNRGAIAEINDHDAGSLGIVSGDRVRVESRVAAVEAEAKVSADVRPGVVVMEQGWGGRTFDPHGRIEPSAHGINCNELVANDDLSPLAAVPRLNGTPVRIEKPGRA